MTAISRKKFLEQHKKNINQSNIKPHSEGLPDSMLANQKKDEDDIMEVLEDNFVEEIDLPTPQIKLNSQFVNNPTQSEIQAMQYALAQTIHHAANVKPVTPQVAQQPYLSSSEQYAPQAQVFQQFQPQQQYVPEMRNNPPQQDSGYVPQVNEQSREMVIKASFEDPDKPLYVVNLTTQAVFFTNLYGPDTEINECTMGTIASNEPNFSSPPPYMIIPSNKKQLALQHDYFIKYLQRGYIKVVTKQEYQNFAYNYNEKLNQAIENKKMLEAIQAQSNNGMISVSETGGTASQYGNPQYQRYMQMQQSRAGFGTEIVNISGTGNEIVNPNDINRQQSILNQTGIDYNPENSWGDLII